MTDFFNKIEQLNQSRFDFANYQWLRVVSPVKAIICFSALLLALRIYLCDLWIHYPKWCQSSKMTVISQLSVCSKGKKENSRLNHSQCRLSCTRKGKKKGFKKTAGNSPMKIYWSFPHLNRWSERVHKNQSLAFPFGSPSFPVIRLFWFI